MAVSTKRVRLGEILIKAGVLEESQLNEALARQQETREQIGEVLTKMGFVTEEKIKYALELQFGVKHINLKNARIPYEVLKLLPDQLLKQYQMVPVQINQLTVALVDPNNILAIDEIRKRLRGVNVVPAVCTETDFWETYKAMPKDGAAPPAGAGFAPAVETKLGPRLPELTSVTDAQLKDLLEKANKGGGDAAITPLVNALLGAAVSRRASSISLEPMEHEVVMRFRVDGQMVKEPALPGKLGQSVAQRIKVMAGLSVTSGHAPQAGTFDVRYEGRPVKASFHSMPARHGQVMTIRLFDSLNLASHSLDQLVPHPRVAAALRQLLGKNAGLLLFGGPHGAGKSLLMATCLRELQSGGASIITVENPIEYDLDGVTQVAVAAEPGANDLSMAAGLHSALMQHPSVFMIGGVEDPTLAKPLVRGSLAGTLVLAGMTTTQSVLVEAKEGWDLPVRLVTSAIAGTVTQRLVRRLCARCKRGYTPEDPASKAIARFTGATELQMAVGCEACSQSGFVGQVGVYEVIPFTPQIRELAVRGAGKPAIDQAARQLGLLTLQDYAMWLVGQGQTTWDEIKRTDILELAQTGNAEAAAPQGP